MCVILGIAPKSNPKNCIRIYIPTHTAHYISDFISKLVEPLRKATTELLNKAPCCLFLWSPYSYIKIEGRNVLRKPVRIKPPLVLAQAMNSCIEYLTSEASKSMKP